MRVLIMGSNARTGSSRYADRYLTFAGLLREAHRQAGDDVWIRNWEPDILREGWGRVYLGLSSLAYVGSDRVFGTLITLAEMRDGPDHDPRLRLFLDDPNLRVLRNSISSVAKDQTAFFAPFNVKRQDYDLVMGDDALRKKVVRGVKILSTIDQPWPTTYVPAFPWGDADRLTRALLPAQRENVEAVDLTAFVPSDELVELAAVTPVSSALVSRDPFWIAEAEKQNSWIRNQHVRAPILGSRVGNDAARISMYRQALGVMEPRLSTAGPGWWSSRMVLAALSKTYYASEWHSLMGMADHAPYVQTLPPAFEELNDLEREMLAAEQARALAASTWTTDRALEALNVSVRVAP